MLNEHHIPKVVALFGVRPLPVNHFYTELIYETLRKMLPTYLFSEKATANQKDQFQSLLPLIVSIPFQEDPLKISFYLLGKYRSNLFKYFFEMISRWLVPGKRLNVILIYAADFCMPDLGSEAYTMCEIVVQVDDEEELAQIGISMPILEGEIRLGVESSYYARRILEIKGVAGDEKTLLIQERIAHLVKRLPKVFDCDVFLEMQHVLVICRDEFKAIRDSRHLSRIISIQYLFLNSLHKAVKEAPNQRHLSLKLFKSQVKFASDTRWVVGILVGINFIRDKELFDKKHLLAAIKNHIPSVHPIEGSFFVNRRASENIAVLYLEIEKSDGKEFSSKELRLLREKLPTELKGRIEHLMHPVFMPRNEEEIMRNISRLSRQIRYVRDIPQVIISFDEQTHTHLAFTVILVRIKRSESLPIRELFAKCDTILEFIPERIQEVGTLRKKHIKELTVFRVRFPKENFLRRDHSLDLYKARQMVVSDLSTIIGEFRDFNGGAILKENELLEAVKELLGEDIKYSDLILSQFFFSLTPLVMRMVLEPEALKSLFLMLLQAIEQGEALDCSTLIHKEIDFVFVVMRIKNFRVREDLEKAFAKLNLLSTELASTHVLVDEVHYDGYIYRSDDVHKQHLFVQAISQTISWQPVLTEQVESLA